MPHNAIMYGDSGGGSAVAISVSVTKTVRGATTRVTRPNNTTAYGAFSVIGAAGDARINIVAPALPADSRQDTFSSGLVMLVESAPPASPAFPILMLAFSAQPATVLGDGATLALSDADIALMFPNTMISDQSAQFNMGATTAVSAEILNQSAGVAGRRATAVQSPFFNQAGYITSARSFWVYLVSQGAYNPLASETIDLYTWWTYPAQVVVA